MSTKAQSSREKSVAFRQPHRIIIFSRYSVPGQVKTRLIPALGAEQAAQLQILMSRHTINRAIEYCSGRTCAVEVRFAEGDPDEMAHQIGIAAQYRPQQGLDLGDRLRDAVERAFQEGTQRVVVIGADCPELNPDDLRKAFHALSESDMVLGPALDGGYYLIGLREHRPDLFHRIDWGTNRVAEQTLAIATQARLRVFQLPLRSDVDYPEDLLICRRLSPLFADVLPLPQPGLLSIIIPTWNEASTIERTLSPLMPVSGVEVLVADGGSEDATVEIAQGMGARVLKCRPGRGRQMNAAAAQARGETLLFLHADTRLPTDFQKHMWDILVQGALAGAFPLRIDAQGALLRIVEWGANIRSRIRHMPYGDQALFLKAQTFYQLGGFPHWPLMEDYEFCRRLRRLGKIKLAPVPVTTSARRWERRGVIRTTLLNQFYIACYHAGLSPDRLARWYSR